MQSLCQQLIFKFLWDLIICSLTYCTYCAKNHQGKEDDSDVSCRKRKVLHLVSQWTSLYKDWLHEDEHLKQFLKVLKQFLWCISALFNYILCLKSPTAKSIKHIFSYLDLVHEIHNIKWFTCVFFKCLKCSQFEQNSCQ